jgi:hypothetical protein
MIMKQIKPGPGFTIFMLFFALALIDAIRLQDWLKVSFWVGIGVVFLLLDNKNNQQKVNESTDTKKPL